jgi:hypothetical protein
MPAAKLVGYTLLVIVGLVAALGRTPSDDATPDIEVSNTHTIDPQPPDEGGCHIDQVGASLRIEKTNVDPVLARRQAIEMARSGSLFGPEDDIDYHPEIDPPAPPRKVCLGRLTSTSGLDRATIRRYMNRHIDQIESCYQHELVDRPAIGGTIVVQFAILPTGYVKDAYGAGFDPTIATCVGNVVGNIAFPQATDIVQVNYPLAFTNANCPCERTSRSSSLPTSCRCLPRTPVRIGT